MFSGAAGADGNVDPNLKPLELVVDAVVNGFTLGGDDDDVGLNKDDEDEDAAPELDGNEAPKVSLVESG